MSEQHIATLTAWDPSGQHGEDVHVALVDGSVRLSTAPGISLWFEPDMAKELAAAIGQAADRAIAQRS